MDILLRNKVLEIIKSITPCYLYELSKNEEIQKLSNPNNILYDLRISNKLGYKTPFYCASFTREIYLIIIDLCDKKEISVLIPSLINMTVLVHSHLPNLPVLSQNKYAKRKQEHWLPLTVVLGEDKNGGAWHLIENTEDIITKFTWY